MFSETLQRHAAATPGRTAVVDARRRLSYAALDDLVDGVAGGLRSRGVGPGDVVTSRLPNGIEAVAVALATVRVGGVHNPVVTSYRDRELGFIRAQAATAVLVEDRADDLFVARLAGGAPADDSYPPDGGTDPSRASFLVYTSGSTADPKGALHSELTLGAEVSAQARYHALGADEVFVTPSSVGHVSGLVYGVLLPLWLGATCVLMEAWDPERFLALVEAEGGTFSGGAPAFLRGALDVVDLDRFDLSSLRVLPCGGADVPPELVREVTERLGARCGRGYGSTEFPSITSSAGPGEAIDRRAGTDGRPIGENRVRIVDDEIQARGPELFLGYRDPGLDADAFTDDGWFRTGDLGVVDGDGYLTVIGRAKDVIVRSGEKISAAEVEAVLAGHPSVAAVAVVARPDATTGEQACACVVPRHVDDPPTLAELAAFVVDAGLSRRKAPERIELLAELPMTAGGKVDKAALRDRGRRDG